MEIKINSWLKNCKNMVFFTFLLCYLNSCQECDNYGSSSYNYGIVCNKSSRDVFLSPVDAKRIEWAVAFDLAYDDEITRNLYLNMNIGDKVCFYKNSAKGTIWEYSGFWIIPSKVTYSKGSAKVKYFIKSINGIEIDKLPNLTKATKETTGSINVLEHNKDINHPEKETHQKHKETTSDLKLLERHGIEWPRKEHKRLVFPKSDLSRFFETMDEINAMKDSTNGHQR